MEGSVYGDICIMQESVLYKKLSNIIIIIIVMFYLPHPN